jgi:CRP-like cAMP-binding protein
MIRLAQALSIKSGESRMASLMIGIMLFIIATGEVSVIASKDQKEAELARRKAGEFIGEMALLSKAPRNATVEALGDVRNYPPKV